MLGRDPLLAVETCDTNTGKVYYKKPMFGMIKLNGISGSTCNSVDDVFDVWTGGYSCPGERVAMMACISKAGYHSVSVYQWYKDENILQHETYPVVYVQACGVYKCVEKFEDAKKTCVFKIEGIA